MEIEEMFTRLPISKTDIAEKDLENHKKIKERILRQVGLIEDA